jgi:hypothetical protein
LSTDPLVAEDSISFPFDKMTYVDTSQSATCSKLGYRETEREVGKKEAFSR